MKDLKQIFQICDLKRIMFGVAFATSMFVLVLGVGDRSLSGEV